MEEIGEFLGQLIIFLYILTISRYAFRILNKYIINYIEKYTEIYNIYKKLLLIVKKYHNIFGYLTILVITIHFLVQSFSITGFIAASLMLLQVFIGIYQKISKTRNKLWLNVHRMIAIFILLAILIHIS